MNYQETLSFFFPLFFFSFFEIECLYQLFIPVFLFHIPPLFSFFEALKCVVAAGV